MVSQKVRERIREWGGIPLQCSDGQELFTERDYHYWKADYRTVDVTGEIVQLSIWLRKNPSKRPAKGWALKGLIDGWLKKKVR